MPKKSVREMTGLERVRHSLGARMFNVTLLLAVVLSLAAIAFGFYLYSEAITRQVYSEAFNVARTASFLANENNMLPKAHELTDIYDQAKEDNLLDESPEYYKRFDAAQDTEYTVLRKNLDELRTESGADSIYLALIDFDKQKLIYLIDGDYTKTYCRPGKTESYTAEDLDILLDGKDPSAFDTVIGSTTKYRAVVSRTNEFGYICTAASHLDKRDGYQLVAMTDLDMNKVVSGSKKFLAQYVLILFVVTVIIAIIFNYYTRRKIVSPLSELTDAAYAYSRDKNNDEVTGNHFDQLNIHTGDEIENLALTLKTMEEDLTDYVANLREITAEKERIGTELSVASRIQEGMVPHTFPSFPDRREFDLHAYMDTAKQVGGDFYDYFFIDDDHLALVIADVSGKGIPAALFMMASKILIDSQTMLEKTSPAQVLENVNNLICKDNPAEMFVTVWLGILDIPTGIIIASNAGHEYPAIGRNGTFDLLKDKHGFVIGGMEGMKYKDYEIQLNPGDTLFLYTDGVPEATDADNNLFGTERMLDALNKDAASMEALLGNVHDDIVAFVDNASQFDDITMLGLKYCGPGKEEEIKNMAELSIEAITENLPIVEEFVEENLMSMGCSIKTITQVGVAVEEIFVNIAHYAYAPETGMAKISMVTDDAAHKVQITFEDKGIPYNPLEKEDPDTTLSAEERQIGGLGIYMTKTLMDEVLYEYSDDSNKLTLIKEF